NSIPVMRGSGSSTPCSAVSPTPAPPQVVGGREPGRAGLLATPEADQRYDSRPGGFTGALPARGQRRQLARRLPRVDGGDAGTRPGRGAPFFLARWGG